MRHMLNSVLHTLGLAVLLLIVIADVQTAYAQSQNCTKLGSTLNSLNRNRDFKRLKRNTDAARKLAGALQEMESAFVRGGCQETLAAGKKLSRQCRGLARRIVRDRKQYNGLAARVETGQAVAQQRELALQQIARFGCRSQSTARIIDNTTQHNGRQSLFDRLFGGQDDIRSDGYYDYFGFENLSTLRTVCVRACDGYYWPVSFSTLNEFLHEDASRCQAQCPGTDVDLFYYRNPGEDADDMVSLSGQSYKSTPNAFRYRREFDRNCSCQLQISYGSIELTDTKIGGQSRAIVTFEEATFPMPMRDPRRTLETTVAEAIVVPLPRRRPLRPGEEPPARGAIITAPLANAESRTFQFGDKTIRIVGPDTPYAQSAATGS